MSGELSELVEMMLTACVLRAGDVPLHTEELHVEIERQVDEVILSLAATGRMPRLSPRVARALIPRVLFARTFGGVVEGALDLQVGSDDGAQASDAVLLEWIFVTAWKELGSRLWLEGKLGGA